MDPWMRFEQALHTLEDPSDELELVLADLHSPDLGSAADIQELRASATALLAGAGRVPFGDAIEECSRAWTLGRSGWPSLYLGRAAMSHNKPRMAIDSLDRIPERYFDDQGLHWRTVQLIELEAEARLALGDLAEAKRVILKLNNELRSETSDDIYPPPTALVNRMLLNGPPYDLLSALVEGLELERWFSNDLAEAVHNVVQ